MKGETSMGALRRATGIGIERSLPSAAACSVVVAVGAAPVFWCNGRFFLE
jgi:hypothetical protein